MNVHNKVTIWVVIGIVFSIFLSSTTISSAQTLNPEQTDKNLQLTQLENDTDNLTYSWDTTLDTPRYLRIQGLNIKWQSNDDVKKSYQFLTAYKQLYKINNPFSEFRLVTQQTDSIGMTFVVLQQFVNDVPVNDARLSFHYKQDGSLSSVQGTYIPNLFTLVTKPKLTSDQAVVIVKNKFQLDQSEKPNYVKLVVYDEAVFGTQSAQASLIWQVSIGDYSYYVDAQTAEIIKKYSNISNAYDEETYVESSCDTVDTLTYDEAGLYGSAVDDTDAAALHSEVQNSYNYFNDSTKFDISSTTLDSTVFLNPIKSYTHRVNQDTCVDEFNAAWLNDSDLMYFAQGVYGQDIVAHELTHGVIHHTVALDYHSSAPDALDESYADIFGTMVQYYTTGTRDWIMGENLPSTRSGCSQGIRDLANPSALTNACDGSGSPQPENMYYYSDTGSVYDNSIIASYAFYLLAMGGTDSYSSETVTGIGIDAAEQIYIRVIKDYYLSSNATFTDAYDATMAACLDLSEYDSVSYPITDCETVHDAFHAVGITSDSSYISPYISTSSDTGTPPIAISFDGSGSVAIGSTISSYTWDFGDGTTDTGATVSHTYSDSGTYDVILTVANTDGYSATLDHTITMYASGSISTTTWTTDHSPYIISGSATVGSGNTLTIDPGVVVKFLNTSSSLTVGGTLSAVGTSTDPIIFTSYKDDTYGGDTNGDGSATTPAVGDWSQIKIAGSATANVDYVTMQYGGYISTSYPYTGYPMFLIDDNATSVTLNHSTLQSSKYYTLEIDPGSTSTISNSTIANTNGYNYYAAYVTGGTSTFTGNTMSAGSSYGMYVINASPTLTGNTFTGSAYGLMVSGTSAPTITRNTFTGNTSDGLYISALSSSATTTVTGNTFTGNGYPIWLGTLTTNLTLTGNTGSGNTNNVILLAGSTAGSFTLDIANDFPYVVYTVVVSAGDTLTIDPGVVVKFLNTSSSLTINGTLTAEGTSTSSIVFTSYKDDTNGGDTNGDGTATTPAAGDWKQIKIADSATANVDYVTVQYGGSSDISYPHTPNPMFLIDDNAASVSVNHSTLQYSSYNTIEVDPNSTSVIANSTISNTASQYAVYAASDNSTFTDNTISSPGTVAMIIYVASPTLTDNTFTASAYGINVVGTSAPTISNNTFTGNTYPIYFSAVTSGTSLSGNTGSGNTYNLIILSGSTAGNFTLDTTNDLLYGISTLTVTAGDTLTIDPGVVVKFLATGSITVGGTLSAVGTSTQPIIFTSYIDDTNGGDSNNDGTATSPAAGDWMQIKIADSAIANVDYVTIQYGGYMRPIYPYTSYPMFLIDDNATSVTLDHSTLQSSKYYTLEIDPGSTSTISNSTIANTNSYYAAYVTGGTSTFTGNTMSATSSYGMYVTSASPTVTGNTFTGSTYGVYVTGSTSAPMITDNLITGNTYGLYVSSGTAPVITNNRIYSNTTYGLSGGSSTTTLTAESNWWGSSTGPYNATSNPTGTGNAVSNYVDFTPWLTADPTIDATPPAEATLTLIHKDPWSKNIALAWTNPTDTDFDHVRISRTDSSGTTVLSDAVTATSYVDTTVSYGTSYIYTIYTLDATGNVSTGITTAAQVVRNPFPTNLILTPGNTTIAATWNASSAPAASIGTYKIYYGTAPTAMTNVIDVGNVTSTTISGLTNGTQYFVSVIVFSKGGVASPRSVIKAARPHP